MGEHDSWFHLLPGYDNLRAYLQPHLGREVTFLGFERTHFAITHVVVAAFVVLLLLLAGLRYASSVGASGYNRVVPATRFGIRNLFELIIEATLSIAEGVMGRENAERFLPLIGTFVFFILFNNLIGLVPGFIPPTDTLKTNLALSGVVLLVTVFMGLLENPKTYIGHFVGPVWWLIPLILVIELISQLVIRPISLALRLLGNMFADHKLLSTITLLVPALVPLPFYVLGILVCVVQTLVFSLLAMIYIGEAVTHHESH